MTIYEINGLVADDLDVLANEPGLTTRSSHRIRLDRGAAREEIDLMACRVADILVSTCFLPIHLPSQRLMLNQSYDQVIYWFPFARPQVNGATFQLTSDPIILEEPHVLIGGPIDGVWYHWLVSWCARIRLLKMVRPDLFDDPSVKFLMFDEAANSPFFEVAMAMGIPRDRLNFVGHARDYLLKDAILVTFPDQRYLYPEVVQDFVETMKGHFPSADSNPALPTRRRRIFASRQGFSQAKRRIDNWDQVAPVLDAFGFEVVELGKATAREQVEMFAQAEFVLGVHGSDLANLMFCPPDARILVIENQRNVDAGISASLDILAGIVGATYDCLVVEERIDPTIDNDHFPNVHNRDVIVDPGSLAEKLRSIGCAPVGTSAV